MPAQASPSTPGNEQRAKRRQWIQAAVKFAISACLLWLVFQRFHYHDLRAEVARTRVQALVLPFAIVFASNLLGALQWGRLVRAAGLAVAWSRLLAVYFAGLFFNNFGIGNVGGDVYKIYWLGRTSGAMGRVAGATIVDRVVGAAALCVLALVAATAGLWHGDVPGLLAALVLIFACGTLAAAGVILHPRVGRQLEVWLQSLPLGGSGARLLRLLGYLQEYRQRVGLLHGVFLLSLCIQAARVLAHFCVGVAMGWNVQAGDLSKFFLVIPVLGLLIVLPISIGGWGVREWAGVALFTPLGRSGAEAVTLLALTALLTFAVSLLGGLVVLGGSVPWPGRTRAAS